MTGLRVSPEAFPVSIIGNAVVLVVLSAIGAAAAFTTYDGLTAAATVPLFAVLAAFTVAAIASPQAAPLQTITGVLAISVFAAILGSPLIEVTWRAAWPWFGYALRIIALIGFLVGVWRLTGLFGDVSRGRRGAATLAGLVIAMLGSEWTTIRPALAAEIIAASAPEDNDFSKLYDRYRALPIEDALIEQSERIGRTFAALPAHGKTPETFVLAVGGSGNQEIFDREARRAAQVLATRGGGPSIVMSNSPGQVESGILSSPKTVGLVVAAIGKRAGAQDTLVIYLTSHGSEEAQITMDAPRLDFDMLSATTLADNLQQARIKRRIIIVSACYAATWIKPLASPSTILITAADVDRTSFGCDDSRDFTVFGKAILGELGNRKQSLAQAFARAKLQIAAEEQAEGATPSLPQVWVGDDMAEAWTRP